MLKKLLPPDQDAIIQQVINLLQVENNSSAKV